MVVALVAVAVRGPHERGGADSPSAVLTAMAGGVWVLRGRPAPPSFRAGCALRAGDAARSGRGRSGRGRRSRARYSAALAIATPPNDYDALWYHLPRAAFWRQEHAVGYVERANDLRLDVFTPGAEIVSSWIDGARGQRALRRPLSARRAHGAHAGGGGDRDVASVSTGAPLLSAPCCSPRFRSSRCRRPPRSTTWPSPRSSSSLSTSFSRADRPDWRSGRSRSASLWRRRRRRCLRCRWSD